MTAARSNGAAQRHRPRILVLNQYYWPGVEATATLLHDLCRELASEFEVIVVTGQLRGVKAPKGRTFHEGVEIMRVRSTAYDRASLPLRALNYLTYMVQSLREAFRARRPDVVLCMTDPPMIADVGLLVAKRFGVPLVVVIQDVFPEVAVELKRLENPLLVSLLRHMIAFYLRRADRVVAIGDTMRRRLEEKGVPPDRVRVIPNWVDASAIRPAPRDNEWSRKHGLEGQFVVMHSGNLGHAQDLDSLLRAATFLRDLDALKIVVIGTGARHAELLELAERLETDQVVFLPFQPREQLSLSLSSAQLHIVGLARGLSGYVVPSRIYGILSAARPVLAAAEPGSETAELVESIGCGIVAPPGRPELIATAIRRAYNGDFDLDEMGRRGREYVTSTADRRVALDRYRELFAELLQERR